MSRGLDRFGLLRLHGCPRLPARLPVAHCTTFDSLTREMSTVRGNAIVVRRGMLPIRGMRLFAESVFPDHRGSKRGSGRVSTGHGCMRDGQFEDELQTAGGGLTCHHAGIMSGKA
jgi:hypothetical protein